MHDNNAATVILLLLLLLVVVIRPYCPHCVASTSEMYKPPNAETLLDLPSLSKLLLRGNNGGHQLASSCCRLASHYEAIEKLSS